MSDNESNDVNVSVSLPPPPKVTSTTSVEDDALAASARSEVSATSDLEQVKEILKSTRDADPLEDKESFYPLQQKTSYMSPVCTLSSESKRIIRQAQVPILQASPRVVHFLYEVSDENLSRFFSLTFFADHITKIMSNLSKFHFFCLFVSFVCLFTSPNNQTTHTHRLALRSLRRSWRRSVRTESALRRPAPT